MPISIHLDCEFKARLDLLAEKTGRSRVACLREAVERGLAEIEDYYLAAHVLERVSKGEQNTYAAAEVREDLGLGD